MYNKEFEVGEKVMFPSDSDNYQMKEGLLLGFHDNPADVELRLWETPGSFTRGPRQVADILYNGKHMTCWKHSLQGIGIRFPTGSQTKSFCDLGSADERR